MIVCSFISAMILFLLRTINCILFNFVSVVDVDVVVVVV